MWYSGTKIGIGSIDMEHGNIDTMLSMIISGKTDQQLIGNLIDSLINHFKNEEVIIRKMGKSFPAKHHEEHDFLTSLLLSKKRQWHQGEIDTLELAQLIKHTLLCHIAEFDKQLTAEKS